MAVVQVVARLVVGSLVAAAPPVVILGVASPAVGTWVAEVLVAAPEVAANEAAAAVAKEVVSSAATSAVEARALDDRRELGERQARVGVA